MVQQNACNFCTFCGTKPNMQKIQFSLAPGTTFLKVMRCLKIQIRDVMGLSKVPQFLKLLILGAWISQKKKSVHSFQIILATYNHCIFNPPLENWIVERYDQANTFIIHCFPHEFSNHFNKIKATSSKSYRKCLHLLNYLASCWHRALTFNQACRGQINVNFSVK